MFNSKCNSLKEEKEIGVLRKIADSRTGIRKIQHETGAPFNARKKGSVQKGNFKRIRTYQRDIMSQL